MTGLLTSSTVVTGGRSRAVCGRVWTLFVEYTVLRNGWAAVVNSLGRIEYFVRIGNVHAGFFSTCSATVSLIPPLRSERERGMFYVSRSPLETVCYIKHLPPPRLKPINPTLALSDTTAILTYVTNLILFTPPLLRILFKKNIKK